MEEDKSLSPCPLTVEALLEAIASTEPTSYDITHVITMLCHEIAKLKAKDASS